MAGVLSTTPQTPLSHVNLRAAQNNVPNAYIRDVLSNSTLSGLIDRPVYYKVTDETWHMRAATLDEVNAHFDSSRPSTTQRLRRILSDTTIQAFSAIGFGSCEAYGVKASNLAVLGTLGFPAGTVPSGYAIPFRFYHEFIKQPLGEETLFGKRSWPDADKNHAGREHEADRRRRRDPGPPQVPGRHRHPGRDAGRPARCHRGRSSPQWIIDALTAMHANYPAGQSLRYRSSTNNENLPGFNGAGLYDSNTQKPSETEEDGIAARLLGISGKEPARDLRTHCDAYVWDVADQRPRQLSASRQIPA